MENNNAKDLELAVSSERLMNCALKTKDKDENELIFNKPKHLYQLYLGNESLSKEMRFILSQFEILLRNSINKAIIPSRGEYWILDL
jgi:predicted nuclease of predicted toxin-antitoxin system